jgi:hypothetical protein
MVTPGSPARTPGTAAARGSVPRRARARRALQMAIVGGRKQRSTEASFEWCVMVVTSTAFAAKKSYMASNAASEARSPRPAPYACRRGASPGTRRQPLASRRRSARPRARRRGRRSCPSSSCRRAMARPAARSESRARNSSHVPARTSSWKITSPVVELALYRCTCSPWSARARPRPRAPTGPRRRARSCCAPATFEPSFLVERPSASGA